MRQNIVMTIISTNSWKTDLIKSKMNPNNQNKYHQQPTLSQAQYNPNLRAQKPDKTKKQQKQGKTYFKKKKYRQIH